MHIFSPSTIISSSQVNANFQEVLGMAGEIKLWGGTSAPSGWLLCDGSAVSRVTYASLYNEIGTTFGAGNGSTTFNLPDLRDKFAIGKSATKALGSTGGSATHTHTGPSHRHTGPSHTHTTYIDGFEAVFSGVGGSQKEGTGAYGHYAMVTTTGTYNRTSASSGTGYTSYAGTNATGSTSTLPSYQALNYIIKA